MGKTTKKQEANKGKITDENIEEPEAIEYTPSKDVIKLTKLRKRRWEQMVRFKDKLGINEKCDRMDAIFTPHLTSLDSADSTEMQFSNDFDQDNIILDKARKSMPLAFQKITTAIAVLIAEGPRGVMRATRGKDKKLNELAKNVYYENFKVQKKKKVLRKYAYHIAKYGLGYWREYIKKTYKQELVESLDSKGETVLDENGKIKWKAKMVYDVFDVVGENLHPHRVVLDDACNSVKDVNKPARDAFIYSYLSQDEFDDVYPQDSFDNSKHIVAGQKWMLDDKTYNNAKYDDEDKKPIQVIEYENRMLGVKEIWAGDWVLLDVSPLPGGEISINGEKWEYDKDDYDGIGIGQIIEIYLPLLDDIANASNEVIRMMVRPHEDFFNGASISDESDDINFGSGNKRKIDGDKDDVKYSSPELKSNTINEAKADIKNELDLGIGVTDNLSGIDEADTAYQSAQNREAALKRLSTPLDSIKSVIEDCANLDLKLYKVLYSQPMETVLLKKGDSDWNEASSILSRATEEQREDERVVVMKQDKDGNPLTIARRKFREMELPLAMEKQDNKPTGRVIETEEKEHWEILPLDYSGTIEIEAKSFLPVSKAVEDEQDKNSLVELMKIQTTDEMGNPTLKDASGVPYTIDKVKVIKDYIEINERLSAEEYVVKMDQQNINQDNIEGNPLAPGGQKIGMNEQLGRSRPELKNNLQTNN